MKSGATTAIILETTMPRKDGLFPVKIRVTYRRSRHYYTLRDEKGHSIAMTKNQFTKTMSQRPRDPYKEKALYLHDKEEKARKVISKMLVFSFKDFERDFFSDLEDAGDLFGALATISKELSGRGSISYSIMYNCTLNSLKSFTKHDRLSFSELDETFLNNYEKWMIKEGNSLTTIGIYLRNVRTAYNREIKAGRISEKSKPFGIGKYQIPTGRNIKKALTLEQVGKIANYEASADSSLERYRDYWLFSYLCNGINVKDMARLTYGNIDGDLIRFTRAKTSRETKSNPVLITVIISKLVGRIIDKWGNKPGTSNTYIFPILKQGITNEQEYARIQQTVKMINKYINIITKDLEFPHRVTSYTARHSFATVLKRSGASIEFISESLGHTSVKTTANYLSDFETETKRKFAEELEKFNQE